MSIKKVSITINSNMEDLVSSIIEGFNINSVLIEDKIPLTAEELSEMYVDIPLAVLDDGKAVISFFVDIVSEDEYKNKISNVENDNKYIDNSYFGSNESIFTKSLFDELVLNIKNKLNEVNEYLDLGDLEYNITELEDVDYMKKWRDNFTEFFVDDILIKPVWDEQKGSANIVISIDPGMAFGTGMHETTRLCMRELKNKINELSNIKNIENIKMLDIGCGSCILGILAYKLGVRDILSIDVDKNIDETIKNNLKANNISTDEFKILYGNIIDDENIRKQVGYNNYDIIVANILAPVIEALVDVGRVDEFLNENGYFIASGIIVDKKEEVIDCFNKNKNLEIINVLCDGDWICIVSKKVKK